ncbi:hypothetical protein CIB84_004591 [Bambusicola thoracicus]|uniref:Cleavage and polyadenylation specificity factor subunit 4 n=1 Tax=Bambusicola thoracicus TaxID=9083 RepID=A0A2P4T5R2_BAMTH|nr:hypothetical protein CIB84_004591 [Bambusicola thoracicus]
MCPFRHISGEKTVVCKHWLRGLCKKGDQCEFLHEYDMTKMPECYFYSKFGKKRCSSYLVFLASVGVCPRFELPMGTTEQPPLPQPAQTQQKCGEKGHYANRCTKGHLAFLSGQ